jgi:hypothetical protein
LSNSKDLGISPISNPGTGTTCFDERLPRAPERTKKRGLLMELNHWDIILWVSGYFGNVCLMAVLCAKKRSKAFPWVTLFLGTD